MGKVFDKYIFLFVCVWDQLILLYIFLKNIAFNYPQESAHLIAHNREISKHHRSTVNTFDAYPLGLMLHLDSAFTKLFYPVTYKPVLSLLVKFLINDAI